MGASFTLDLTGLKKVIDRFTSPQVRRDIEEIPKQKAVAALIGQAIAENFDMEGPGWQPLKAQTIRNSVSKAKKKKLSGMSDEDLLKHEASARSKGQLTNRRILQKTGMLKKSATIPGMMGAKGGNIYKVDGTNIIWGTNLSYAAIHNSGGNLKFPGTKNGFGRGIKIPAHSIPIPKREFLKIRDEWMNKINDFMVEQILQRIHKAIKEGG